MPECVSFEKKRELLEKVASRLNTTASELKRQVPNIENLPNFITEFLYTHPPVVSYYRDETMVSLMALICKWYLDVKLDRDAESRFEGGE